jgi:hypothetical protein
VYFGLAKGSIQTSALFYLVSVLALITHGYRDWQYFIDIEHKFCFNPPLFIVNNVKVIGLVVMLVSGLFLR